MKYLKYILGIVLLLIILFFLRGLLTPSIYYESEIEINKPASEVWKIMSDESKLPEWIDGIKRTEHVSGPSNQVGAVSNIYFDQRGKEEVMQETIKEMVENQRIAMDFTMDFMNMEYSMDLKETNGKTQILSKTKTMGNGLFAKSMVSWMKGTMKNQEDTNLVKLKGLVERN